MAQARYYSSIAEPTTLTAAIDSSATSIAVAATTGFPGSTPFTLALDYGADSNELVEVTNVGGLNLTVTRAIDGTSATSHNVGAVVRHVVSAQDFTESRVHEDSTAAHGATGAVVGTTNTQTLTNKTLTNALGSLRNIQMFNVGAVGITQIIGDSANTGTNRLEIKDDELAGNIMSVFRGNGALFIHKQLADTDSTYRLRITDNNQTTDRFAVLAGGTVSISPTSTTTSVPLDIVAADTSVAKRAIRLAASGGGTERFTVWNDGRVDIAGTAIDRRVLDVIAPAGMTADVMSARSPSDSTYWAVQPTGRMLANVGAVVAQPGVLSGIVLQVGGSNAGYTGNLQAWVNPSNTIVASMNQDGDFTATSVSAGSTFSSDTLTDSPTVVVVAGWSLTSVTRKLRGGVTYATILMQRTGGDINIPANGNISPDLQIISTLAANISPTETMYIHASTGVGSGSARINTDQTVDLTDWTPNASIATGANLRFSYTYIE